MWKRLKTLRKFTKKAEIDRLIGPPAFQLEDRPAYYYGRGFVVCYTPEPFGAGGPQRIWRGEPGGYGVSVIHFSDAAALKEELGLPRLDAEDAAPFPEDILEGVVTYRSTFRQIHRWAAETSPEDYREGETRRLAGGLVGSRMEFQNLFIQCGQYELYFYGESKDTRVTGFQFVFSQ